VSRPRTTEDIEAVRTRAAVRLERRMRTAAGSYVRHDCGDPTCVEPRHLTLLHPHPELRREAAALVAALDALLDENQSRYAWGDR
jgi:hypothetical protein